MTDRPKRKRALREAPVLVPGAERIIAINLSARLRAFYTALAAIESVQRGYVVTAKDIIRGMRKTRKRAE